MKLPLVAYVELISNVIPLGCGIFSIKRLRGGFLFFFAFILLNTTSEFITFFMGRAGIKNLWVLSIEHVVEYTILSITLSQWQQSARIKLIIYGGILFYVILWISAKFTVEPFSEPDVYTHGIECVALITISIYTLLGLQNYSHNKLIGDGRFLVTAGLLIYFGGGFVLYVFWKEIVSLGYTKAASYWVINWSLNTLVNLVYALGLWRGAR